MTPLAVIDLIVSIAKAFGLSPGEVLAFAQQKHPELRTTPIRDEGEQEMDRARREALERAKG
jgi:hypothetical protein